MMDFQNTDLAILEELKNKARVTEDWFESGLDSLSVYWNPTLAHSLYSYLLAKLDGNYYVNDDFDLPANQDSIVGELKLARILGKSAIELRLPLEKTPRHLVFAGTSGSGKTNAAIVLAESAYQAGIHSVKINDPKAEEYIPLAAKYPDTLCLNWKDLRFNPLKPPPNVAIDVWHQVVTGHLSETLNFWHGAESVILKTLAKLFNHNPEATIIDLLHAIESTPQRFKHKDAIILSTVTSRLELLLYTLGEVITTNSEMLQVLSDKQLILSTTGLMSEIESFLSEFLLLWDSLYRTYNPSARHLTINIMDECQHRLFSRAKEYSEHKRSASLITKLVDEARALNMAICSLSQEPSTLLKSVLNNSYLKVCFHLSSGGEVTTMSQAMALTSQQSESLHSLETGEAIIRMAGGYMEPLPVKFYKFEEPTCVDWIAFWRHQKEQKERLYKQSGVNRSGIKARVPDERAGDGSSTVTREVNLTKQKSTNQKTKARQLAESLIKIWLNLPDRLITWRQLLNLTSITSGSTQSKLKYELIRLAYIVEHRLQVGKGFLIVPEPTEAAFRFAGVTKPKLNSKGGYLHQFVAHHIWMWAKKNGFTVDVEFFLSNNKAVDVVLRKHHQLLFIEIAISPPLEKEINNTVKDIGTELTPDRLLIATRDGKAKRKLEQLISADSRLGAYRDKIEVVLAGDFLAK